MHKVHVPPSPRIKYAIARTGYDWKGALLEIFDNCADAIKERQKTEPGFKGQISISCPGYKANDKSKRAIVVQDNGCGVDSKQDADAIAKVWSLGGSGKSGGDGGSYGVFGMGLKGAVQAMAGSATFTSRSADNESFQTSLYQSSSESFEIPVFATDELSEDELERRAIDKMDGPGSFVVLRDIKAGPVSQDQIYDALEVLMGRIYKSDLENGLYTIKLGQQGRRILDESSGIDPLDGGEYTNWLLGGPKGVSHPVEFEGHTFKLRLSHSVLGVGRSATLKTLGSGIKGSRKRGAYYIRMGREISIETTEGKNLPWCGGLANISNLFLEVEFEDSGVDNFPIQTDFGKKGITQTDEFRKFLSDYIEHHVATVKANTSKDKKLSGTQEEVQQKVGATFSNMIRSVRSAPVKPSPTKPSSKERRSNEGRASIKRQRYVGKTKKIDVTSGSGVKSVFEFRHVEDYKARDLPFWLEVGKESGIWVVVLNEANAFVSNKIANDLEGLYMLSTANVLAMKEVIKDEDKIIEATEYFGQLSNEYWSTSKSLSKASA